MILDVVRADHLSIYGYERDTTPRLREFLNRYPEAVRYQFAHANGTWTPPSHASLLTGLMPSEHGVQAQTAVKPGGDWAQSELLGEETLAERVSASGYNTAAVFANYLLRHVDGLGRGFDWYLFPLGPKPLQNVSETIRSQSFPDLFPKVSRGLLGAETINARVLDFIEKSEPAPWFVAANYWNAHAPYVPRHEHAGRYGSLERDATGPPQPSDGLETIELVKARYDEEIRGLDSAIGRLIQKLESRGILENTWLVITSDHGEAFGEHGEFEHGSTVYGEVTRVPLIVKPPEGASLPRPGGAVDLLDVAATLSTIASGSSIGVGCDLRDPCERDVQIELFPWEGRQGRATLEGYPARAVLSGTLKLIVHATGRELYDLSRDLREKRNLIEAEPDAAARLGRELPPLESAGRRGRSLTTEEKERLRALGYIHD